MSGQENDDKGSLAGCLVILAIGAVGVGAFILFCGLLFRMFLWIAGF